ncbi:alanyl-tRNA synthetase [Williamsoniiplasma somnilux]|uniref:Alanine--tRNA ligase n=1 Tax=Williamsoniiplasma somnilux TaxID=215578 RepID=A0A2K8NXG3_9MOLU|nr:alanine--tRNA ligase [Williamsoniiplasma somnilux]ATZ18509.1 alanyl-tRNA synthetase [Williamsoniiplasma somnilux]
MKKLTTNQIRKMWLDFFKEKKHHFLAPVSLIPVDDPSLLWINSGVATLKPYFDGRKTPPAPRLTNSQKAIRTNDIENVGVTARHQTMFEMLGNFSIGEYFKKEAIEFAWELLTSSKWFAIPVDKLYITVFSEDKEAYKIWTEVIGIAPDHIFSLGRETNFWDVGQGPCGPNTEMFFDRGEKWDPKKIGPRLIADDIENDRFIEIWNIVFSQFNNDGTNNYTELPRKNIDTGAGLERIASIFQDTPTNFETDIFFPTIKKVETLCDPQYTYSIDNYMNPTPEQTKINTAFKVIADHVRATSFAIADGVFPGNKDRGYIIRRLIRRSSVYGKELGIRTAFLYKLVIEVINAMGEFYPYLKTKQTLIEEAIRTEEEKFLKTLAKGYELLEKIINEDNKVSAKNALLLFESFGFPIEQTLEIAEKRNVDVDLVGFEKLLAETKESTRNARKDLKAWDKQNELFTKLTVESKFTGWEETEHENSQIVFMFSGQQEIQTVTNDTTFVILDKTPFYAEKGGQAADTGTMSNDTANAIVLDTQQGPNHQHIHQIKVNGTLKVGDHITAKVDEDKRIYTMKNHSGTHMVHSALREVLGSTVMQAGSFNDENGLRMDFTFNRNATEQELKAVENLVIKKIHESINREVHFCSMNDAINKYHALAFFADKYDDIVRVVKFGDFSSELCGGTHVENTKDIEDFIITGIESKGSGLFRIKCLTSFETVNEYLRNQFKHYFEEVEILIDKYNIAKNHLVDKQIEQHFDKIKSLEISKNNLDIVKKLISEFKDLYKSYDKKINDILMAQKLNQFKDLKPTLNSHGVNEIKLFTKGLNIADLKQLADELRNKFADLILILGSETENDNFIVVAVSRSLQNKYRAIDIFNNLKEFTTKGGGNANLAQGKYFYKQ